MELMQDIAQTNERPSEVPEGAFFDAEDKSWYWLASQDGSSVFCYRPNEPFRPEDGHAHPINHKVNADGHFIRTVDFDAQSYGNWSPL